MISGKSRDGSVFLPMKESLVPGNFNRGGMGQGHGAWLLGAHGDEIDSVERASSASDGSGKCLESEIGSGLDVLDGCLCRRATGG